MTLLSPLDVLWSRMYQQYQSNKELMDTDDWKKIISLLNHSDIEYIEQGWQLLLCMGVEQIFPILKLENGELRFRPKFIRERLVEKALLHLIHDAVFRELTELYEAGGFDEMEWPFLREQLFATLSPLQKHNVLRHSTEMIVLPKDNCSYGIIQEDFLVGKYPVTQGLWETVMGENPSVFQSCARPVENVSWFDCVEFCNQYSQQVGLQPVYLREGNNVQCDWSANGYRLLKVEEWVYAAQAGKDFRYSGSNNLQEVGWFNDNSRKSTHPVGLKKGNDFGLYDVSGNVYEWLWDNDGYPKYRVMRGGAWHLQATNHQLNVQANSLPEYASSTVGLRIRRAL